MISIDKICNNTNQASCVAVIDENVSITPTNPAVPIPAPTFVLVICSKQEEIGPKIALAMTGGSQSIGFRIRLGI